MYKYDAVAIEKWKHSRNETFSTKNSTSWNWKGAREKEIRMLKYFSFVQPIVFYKKKFSIVSIIHSKQHYY